MCMQRRHFQLVAKIIKAGNNYPTEEIRRLVALDFASSFAASNPEFNRDKFLTACGVRVYP